MINLSNFAHNYTFHFAPMTSALVNAPRLEKRSYCVFILEPMAGIEPATSSLPRMRSTPELHRHSIFSWAEDGAQTRGPQLGRLMLYRLSYFRNIKLSGKRWTRTTEPEGADLQSAAIATMRSSRSFWASCRIRTNDPEITNHVLWPTELKRHSPSIKPHTGVLKRLQS